jgi:hypothetical protein
VATNVLADAAGVVAVADGEGAAVVGDALAVDGVGDVVGCVDFGELLPQPARVNAAAARARVLRMFCHQLGSCAHGYGGFWVE